MIIDKVAKDCLIYFGGRGFVADLILLDINDFDVILGIDLLVAYQVIVDCFGKRVAF